jgi:oligopeptide/dipeptide ABC transporter ATP-binding protein
VSVATDVLLRVQDLAVRFPTEEGQVHAVDGVSFDVRRGKVLGLVGESGCGKSVTCLSMLRLVPAPGKIVSGRVDFGGRDLLQLPIEEMRAVRGKEIAMIFQDAMTALNPVLTLGDQLVEALRLHLGLGRRAAYSRAIELLDVVGIPAPRQRISEYAHQLSGGMRQRVMIAMALSCDPAVLLADEPTTALDVTVQAQILDLIRQLPAQGRSVLLITHDLGVVAETCDDVAVMYAGEIVERAPTAELFRSPQHPYTQGLLRSVPRLDIPRNTPLTPIEGSPPDLLRPPRACRFQPRCVHAQSICSDKAPELSVREAPEHLAACHGTEVGGWI